MTVQGAVNARRDRLQPPTLGKRLPKLDRVDESSKQRRRAIIPETGPRSGLRPLSTPFALLTPSSSSAGQDPSIGGGRRFTLDGSRKGLTVDDRSYGSVIRSDRRKHRTPSRMAIKAHLAHNHSRARNSSTTATATTTTTHVTSMDIPGSDPMIAPFARSTPRMGKHNRLRFASATTASDVFSLLFPSSSSSAATSNAKPKSRTTFSKMKSGETVQLSNLRSSGSSNKKTRPQSPATSSVFSRDADPITPHLGHHQRDATSTVPSGARAVQTTSTYPTPYNHHPHHPPFGFRSGVSLPVQPIIPEPENDVNGEDDESGCGVHDGEKNNGRSLNADGMVRGGYGGEVVVRGCFGRSASPSRIFRNVNARNDMLGMRGIPLAFGPANLNHAYGSPVQAQHTHQLTRFSPFFSILERLGRVWLFEFDQYTCQNFPLRVFAQ
ncbi:hypothetical protein CPB86DRAFT_296624 [Serendipita vermifera]|nr:hypothetical protein CPB86DRAFT_296624 [Serendipita vermifera]